MSRWRDLALRGHVWITAMPGQDFMTMSSGFDHHKAIYETFRVEVYQANEIR